MNLRICWSFLDYFCNFDVILKSLPNQTVGLTRPCPCSLSQAWAGSVLRLSLQAGTAVLFLKGYPSWHSQADSHGKEASRGKRSLAHSVGEASRSQGLMLNQNAGVWEPHWPPTN